MKIGILTFHAAFNYGSMLQAYALQTYLLNEGHDVKIINFRSKQQKQIYRKPFASLSLRNLLSDGKRVLKYGDNYLYARQRWDRFNDFMEKNLELTREYDVTTWEKDKKDFDCIITGSDQIWNLAAYDFNDVYFGKGIDKHIKLIAYAPSLGPHPENLDITRLQEFLSRYAAVSVREAKARDFIITHNLYPCVEQVVDPTMLLNINSYHKFVSSESPVKYPYIYYYTPGNHHDILTKSLNTVATLQLPVAVDTGYFNIDFKNSNTLSVTMAGPEQFLSYIKHAELVIGASFHLIVFAILFHKEFICINGDKDSRLNNLLTILGLEERIAPIKGTDVNVKSLNPVNWKAIDDKLQFLRNQSSMYLKRNL